jgi:GT2 family glycosyltransferase
VPINQERGCVLFRLHALYLRYTARHADRLGGFALPKDRRRSLGQVEQVQRANGNTRLVGWTAAPSVTLTWPGGQARAAPSIQRADVMHRFGLPLECGFEVEAPEGARPLVLQIPLSTGDIAELPVAHPSDRPSKAARRRLMRAFLRDLIRAAPATLRWMLRRDPIARREIKRALGLEAVIEGLPLDPRYLAPPAALPRSSARITIILPVHNAFHLLAEALDRVARHTDLPWHLVLIDDASTDARVRPFLRDWAAHRANRVTLVELDENHGFVGAVNRGFAEAETREGHIVLLNSDAMVPEGWASRLIAPIEADPKVGSVTPMSNDAEIFSVPNICQPAKLTTGLVDRIDAVARGFGLPPRLPSAPTGVGFCMAMARGWFDRVPRFDTAFGRGYGEEVDWCQKVRKAGGRHVAVGNLFVEHRGGQSFGGELKEDLVLRANAMIARRYPAYDVEVQAFIGRDPLRTPRLALAIARAGYLSAESLPLFMAHSLGGGADHALEVEIAARTAQGLYALVLRVGGRDRWQIEVHGPGGVVSGTTGEIAHIHRLLAPVPALRIVYSCGVEDHDPLTLPRALLSLRRPGSDDTLEARVHDYFMISPSYCLLASDGCYRGPVLADDPNPAHIYKGRDGRTVPLATWQAEWGAFLDACHEITVFSETSRAQITATYPHLTDRVHHRPHAMIASIRAVAPPADGARTIGVLGNLNRQKGAGVLRDIGEKLLRYGGPRFVHFGNIDPAFSVPPTVKLHGSYVQTDIPYLAERYGVSAWVVPSIWPETFSFVTHEMLATGLPVYGFAIGAQGEALTRAPNGLPIPFDPDADHAQVILDAIAGAFPAGTPLEEAAE